LQKFVNRWGIIFDNCEKLFGTDAQVRSITISRMSKDREHLYGLIRFGSSGVT